MNILNQRSDLQKKKYQKKHNKVTSRTSTNKYEYTVEIVIPAWNEPTTVKSLIKHITDETTRYKIPLKNVWLITHDQKTGAAGLQADSLNIVKHMLIPQEKGGKNASLNAALQKLSADYVIFIDGDITLGGKHPLLTLIQTLHKSRQQSATKNNNSKVGVIAGRPAALDDPNTMLGFWAHTLTHAAHKLRLIKQMHHEYINISGNLYIVQKDALPPKIPLNVIDDAFISLWVQKQGYTILYEPKALAYQHYPKTYKDWLTQKLRNIAGEKLTALYFRSNYPNFKPQNMRTFTQEIRYLLFTMENIRSPKHIIWLLLLYLARLHLWALYFYKIYIRKEAPRNIWENWKRVG